MTDQPVLANHHSVVTAESVTSGHPDKVCDQISDAVLDAFLAGDPTSRVAVECMGSHGLLVIGGEVTSSHEVAVGELALRVYGGIGYHEQPEVIVRMAQQSPDIAAGVDPGGAGDQGIMYGYATDETPELLPRPIVLAHKLTAGLERLRRSDSRFAWLRPDGKAQVTIQNGDVRTALVSCQHDPEIALTDIQRLISDHLIKPQIGDGNYQILVNPTGRFTLGGFTADAGLTGRKIMVDTYGGSIPHGGGAFSGKDPTKVDRSAAYQARRAAVSAVRSGLAKRCLVSVAYAIGRAEPLMLSVMTFGTGDDAKVLEKIRRAVDFTPKGIIQQLNLRRPIFQKTACYGHFGRPEFPWEQPLDLR
ncbi:MAG: S-adenosylmethionine synthetase (Methionine adenosyltransferase) (AdoMet synthetase) (MAT) [Parcubacteria group bacterium Gr01-1014_31]|nr:MAG: S-adenosylmethionine synthetase (Methionine adenosyltransferase) (AdoMet synthetase) (MAT) [Parcubacteria group bacterium Gr01-1014_31]